VYRIAVNYILDVKKSPVERMQLTFQRFGDDLVDGLSDDGHADSERSLLVEEVKIGCTLGMRACSRNPPTCAPTPTNSVRLAACFVRADSTVRSRNRYYRMDIMISTPPCA
jgi:hypothetical protein